MSTPKTTPAEALLRRRAFYLGIPRETLRTAMSRNRVQESITPTDPAKSMAPQRPR